MATFVIVHGAWTGSWSWVRVIDRLRARGHKVHAPTLSGLAERSHLNQLPINLSTHIDDIVNEVLWNDLDDIVLVAHSYGGIVATGAVERLGKKVRSIVYLDAFVPEDGQGFTDFAPGWELSGQLTESPPSSPGNADPSKDDLYREATRLRVPGRSKMTKEQLRAAIKRAKDR